MSTETTVTAYTIHVPEENLRAMLHLAGKNDVRFYLNGLKLEATPTVTRLVATDGHVLGVLESRSMPNIIPAGYFECIIPRAMIEQLPKARSGVIAIITATQITDLHPRRGSIVINGCGVQVSGEAVDADYPPYPRIVPETVTGEAGLYDVELLSKFVSFAKKLGYPSNAIQLRQNGPHTAALVTLSKLPSFVGAVMPMRPDVVDEKGHLWARTSLRSGAVA